MDHFRRGFAAELIKLSAVAPENPPPKARENEGDVAAKALKPAKGLGDPQSTAPVTPKAVSGPLTSMTAMTNLYTSAGVA
jgi:hypothetical protein